VVVSFIGRAIELDISILLWSERRGRMVVGFTTTCAISAYQHQRCELESHSWSGVEYHIITLANCISFYFTENMELVLTDLGFKVVRKDNLKKWEMEHEIKTLARADHKNYDCFAFLELKPGCNSCTNHHPRPLGMLGRITVWVCL
jgi:hypothetical protein